MKLFVTLVALSFLAPVALADDDVTVRLLVRTTASDSPALHDCAVTVPAGSSVADVLDQAQADGCILQWSCVDYGFDCFVDSVDHVQGAPAFVTYWSFYVNGLYADTGVHGTTASPGAVYELEYEQGLLYPSPL